MKIFFETNCAKSLSGVTIKTLYPSFSACFARVPIMSSASNPSFTTVGICIALSSFSMYGIATVIGSGVSSLLAL